MTFAQAVRFILRPDIEGGYVDDPTDPGGVTKYGISKRSYPDLDIASLTVADATGIYKRDFWDKCRCEELPHGLDLLVFNSAINQGAGSAIKLLQLALRITDDGIIGPATIKAANSGLNVVPEFMARQMFRYALNPLIHRDGLGWYRRLALATQSAYQPPEI